MMKMAVGIPGQKGAAKRVVGEWTGSQAKNCQVAAAEGVC